MMTRAELRRVKAEKAAKAQEQGPVAGIADGDAEHDAFARAARAFAFTGETPISVAAAAFDAEPEAEDAADLGVEDVAATETDADDRAPRRIRRARARRSRVSAKQAVTASFSVGVMGVVGLMTIAVGAPAEAVAAATKTDAVTTIEAPASTDEAEAEQIQAYVAPDTATTELGRDETYTMATFSEIAAATGITRHTNFFVNDPSAPIQWPFAAGVPISDGYGPRWGSFHYGLDFTPGEGAQIQAVAGGTVRVASESGAAFGVHVIIDHEIDGEIFSTHYAHMQYGSLQVKAGDTVEVGQFLGLTGNTGLSYGAHLHFEVFVNNQRIDPLTWLREHAGG
jgi:murein DD-endopeptidase MepM/ murein hydrolase activator NlpD